MSVPDLNLLLALDVLLDAGSVAQAARRLQLSPSAMSRTLARLRVAMADPLLVRAGRQLVPTPRAADLRDRARQLVQDARTVLSPAQTVDVAGLERTFTLRVGDGFVESFGPALITRVSKEAPHVRLCLLRREARDSSPLRDGSADLETGVVGKHAGPEVRAQALFRDRFIGVVRTGHALSKGRVTAARYAKAKHVEVSQHAASDKKERGLIDRSLGTAGYEREVSVVVGGFAAAVALARHTDFVASVPERHTGKLRSGMHSFRLPFTTPDIAVSLMWHPRLDADPAHRWLRQCVRDVCAKAEQQ